MMRKTSDLATAAARMHLINVPEGKSSLQTRLDDAERRANEAEVTAQDAQAALARTLLDGARFLADETARIRAESEAAITVLRLELEAAKRSALVRKSLPHGAYGRAASEGVLRGAIALHEDSKPYPIRLTEWELAANRIIDAWDDEADLESDLPPVRDPRAPFRTALLGALLLVSVASYSLTMFLLIRDAGPAVTAMARLNFGMAPTDMRMKGAAATATGSDSGAAGGNWLLHMPVERPSVMRRFAGAE